MKCTFCQDTGMRPGSFYPDCAYCDAVKERTALEDFARELNGWPAREVEWAIYQRGKAAGAAQAVPVGWQAVPVVPTAAMAHAGAMVDDERESTWAAYLNAAPKAT